VTHGSDGLAMGRVPVEKESPAGDLERSRSNRANGWARAPTESVPAAKVQKCGRDNCVMHGDAQGMSRGWPTPLISGLDFSRGPEERRPEVRCIATGVGEVSDPA